MPRFSRITHDPRLFGGKATIRGMRLTVAALLRRLSRGETPEDLLRDYPELTLEDIQEALAYAAWRLEEEEHALNP
ncbi:DUF433 domain-containing protein [Thermus aquaticus]|jgi:uncharacterized protein (DUF433 family)|uniref:Ssl5025 protein n=1 Tax=Thermus aquaticus (strain ATCC BAA-2747 / Y51MC23) TaxID=498848 RepID=A0ABM5VK99_THEA5|nr:DUF433 domain-containing protein [Thermus aquaticus]ALJ90307.1 ssl5025 protein [Thermus aquaticus Y51MC23]